MAGEDSYYSNEAKFNRKINSFVTTNSPKEKMVPPWFTFNSRHNLSPIYGPLFSGNQIGYLGGIYFYP